MTIAPVIPVPVKPAAHNSFLAAPPATPAAFRYAAQSPDLDELVAVGLTLHLFTEVLHGRVGLCLTEMHRATTVLTKEVLDLLTRLQSSHVLPAVLRLVTDPDRAALPDGSTVHDVCGRAWPAVRGAAYALAEQSLRGADDFGVGPMLRLAASRAVVEPSPWFGTPAWRARLDKFMASHTIGELEYFVLSTAPEQAPEPLLLAMVA
jgi:hypothetical protein